MEYLFICIPLFMIVFSYVIYFIMIFMCKEKNVCSCSGFDVTKNIISEYENINVIENKKYLSFYNIKRKIIKLSSFCYYGTNLSAISLSLVESGMFVLDDMKNRYINIFKKIISNLKILYILPIISLLLNNFTYTVGDTIISILILLVFIVIGYILIDIKSDVYIWITDNISRVSEINDEGANLIIKYINKILLLDKILLFGEVIILIRFVAIFLKLI